LKQNARISSFENRPEHGKVVVFFSVCLLFRFVVSTRAAAWGVMGSADERERHARGTAPQPACPSRRHRAEGGGVLVWVVVFTGPGRQNTAAVKNRVASIRWNSARAVGEDRTPMINGADRRPQGRVRNAYGGVGCVVWRVSRLSGCVFLLFLVLFFVVPFFFYFGSFSHVLLLVLCVLLFCGVCRCGCLADRVPFPRVAFFVLPVSGPCSITAVSSGLFSLAAWRSLYSAGVVMCRLSCWCPGGLAGAGPETGVGPPALGEPGVQR